MSRHDPGTALTLVIIQPTSLCNLNCGYCYVPGRTDKHRMPLEMLELAFKKVLHSAVAQERRIEFLWHAGEPLTVGLDYFKAALELTDKLRPAGTTVLHAVQTNGVLVDRAWAEFFAAHDVKVGVSIDGPAELHDQHRPNWAGKGSHARAMRGFRTLQEAGMNPAVLAVLTDRSLGMPDELFDFFVDHEICSFGFNVEEVENTHLITSFGSTNAAPSAALRSRFEAFFSRIFDRWWPVRDLVNVREIRDVVHGIQQKIRNPAHSRRPDEIEDMGIITILKNGDITAFSPELAGAKDERYGDFIVGHIAAIDSIDAIRQHRVYQQLQREIEAGRRACADSCTFYDLCGSAFVSNRFFETGRFDGAESTTCILQRQIAASVVIKKLQAMSLLEAVPYGEVALV